MTKFLGCLALLPNLKTLDIFSVNSNEVLLGLNRKSAKFRNIREFGVNWPAVGLVWRCPNVETITIRGRWKRPVLPKSCGERLKKLKRVVVVSGDVIESGKLKDGFWSEASVHVH